MYMVCCVRLMQTGFTSPSRLEGQWEGAACYGNTRPNVEVD
jgi:hypothetical protein